MSFHNLPKFDITEQAWEIQAVNDDLYDVQGITACPLRSEIGQRSQQLSYDRQLAILQGIGLFGVDALGQNPSDEIRRMNSLLGSLYVPVLFDTSTRLEYVGGGYVPVRVGRIALLKGFDYDPDNKSDIRLRAVLAGSNGGLGRRVGNFEVMKILSPTRRDMQRAA